MGRVPLPGPFFSSAVLATLAARALGADDLLSTLATGEQRGTVALGEMGHGDPLGTVRTRARRKGADWVVSGHKPLVLDGHTADWAIVVARSEEGVRSFLLEHPDAEAVPTLDPTRKAARLVLEETHVQPLGPDGPQGALWRRVLDDVAVALSSELVGVCRPSTRRSHRVRQGPGGLRPPGGRVPGGEAPDGRHVPSARDGPGGRPVRRLGLGHRRPPARAGGRPWPPATRPRRRTT